MSLRSIALLFVALAVAACSRQVPMLPQPPQRSEAWDPAVVEAMASLPLQEGGRVKPFATLAAYTLYFVHGRRDLKFGWTGADGTVAKVTLEPTEWLLDVWCFPDQAIDYPLFRIEHTGVLDALGISNEGQTLDFQYLSYRQMLERGERLGELARQFRPIEPRDRSAVQEHLVNSYAQLVVYHKLHQQLAALHADFQVTGAELRTALGGGERVRLGDIVAHADSFRKLVQSAGSDLESEKLGNTSALLATLVKLVEGDDGPSIFPPLAAVEVADRWHGLGEVVDAALRGSGRAEHAAMLQHLQAAITAKDSAARGRELRSFRDAVAAAANTRGEFDKVELETTYFRQSWHYRSIHWFLLGFVLAAVSWLVPRNKLIWWASFGITTIGLAMLTWDIGLRCVISERPPIKNLYDTFLFIAAMAVLTLLIAEYIVPRRIALALAPLLGAMLVMFARMFEVSKGEDTMAPLVAVLDSNYWLATHVTMINTGYAAGIGAAVLANAWVLVRLLRVAHPSDPLPKALMRMTYGVTCFSLMFSVVGTIYGGVWANDSWGRFWGWDPKENGALMICLSQIALLHARMSGWVRDFGFVVWSCVTGMVIFFSWFHVNLLGVGLHNYGFSTGLRDAVWIGYSVEALFVVLGTVDVLLWPDPARRRAPEPVGDADAALAGK